MGDIRDWIILAGVILATLWYFVYRDRKDAFKNPQSELFTSETEHKTEEVTVNEESNVNVAIATNSQLQDETVEIEIKTAPVSEALTSETEHKTDETDAHESHNAEIARDSQEGSEKTNKIITASTSEKLSRSEEEYFQKADKLIHSSTPVLRSLFRQRWEQTTGSPWKESSSHELISGLGKDVYNRARPMQKRYLKNGLVEEWDISLNGLLLKHIKWVEGGDDLKSKRRKENHAVEKLVQLRNNVAHAPVKKLSEKELKKIEESYRSAMTALNVNENEVESMIANAGESTPVSGWSAASKIFEMGKEKFQAGEYRKAIQLYSDALLVPNLLENYQAVLLENKAASHLKLAEDMNFGSEREAMLEEAMNDVKKSLELKDDSWMAHFIIGRVNKHKNNLESAEEHLRKALALSPGQADVKTELECCKLLLGKIRRSEHLDPMNHPMTFQERIQHFTDETGKPMTKELWVEMDNVMENFLPGHSHVQQGHRYLAGWDVKQDYLQASMCYAKADKLGNAEGTYNLGQLYMGGKGVQQNIPRGMQLYEKAANMPPEITVGGRKLQDIGVVAAQHALGLAYDQGVHFPKNHKEAAKWYEKAAKNGLGKAANNLAVLYHNGTGVEQSIEKAVMYWKLALKEKDMNAAYSLSLYYRREMEPELARIMFERAIEFGNDHLSMIREQYLDTLRELEDKEGKVEADIVDYEKKNNLSAAGMTFYQRLLRRMRGDPDGEVLADSMETQDEIRNSKGQKWPGKVKGFDHDDTERKAMKGSITAQRMIQVLQGSFDLMMMWGSGPPFSDSHKERFVDLFYTCVVMEHHIIRLPGEVAVQVLQYFDALLRIHGNSKNELDRKIRICFYWGPRDNQEVIEVLKVGLQRYPEDAAYYDMLSNMYGMTEDRKLGLEIADKGLSRFPDHVELLYVKAVHTCLLVDSSRKKSTLRKDMPRIRKAYQRFVDKAPKDHRKVPEAYYRIATTFMHDFDYDNILHYYELAEESEKWQLSCYLPYESSSKLLLAKTVKLIKLKKGQNPSASASAKVNDNPIPPPQTRPERSQKLYLQDPWRLIRIKHHRSAMNDLKKNAKPDTDGVVTTMTPRLQHKLPRSLTDLKIIRLNEIDASKDHVYEGRILNLTMIEDPMIGAFAAVGNLAEDENGDVTRIHVYNVPHDATTANQLGFGSRLSVISPYLRIGSNDLIPFIRVDDPKCIIYNEGVKDMCRYCGEENAQSCCAKCKRAKYCSRKCQEKDWKILKHKLICSQ